MQCKISEKKQKECLVSCHQTFKKIVFCSSCQQFANSWTHFTDIFTDKTEKKILRKFDFRKNFSRALSYMYSPAASRPSICEAPGGAGYSPRRCSVSARFTAVAATLETVRIYSKSVSDSPNLYLTHQICI